MEDEAGPDAAVWSSSSSMKANTFGFSSTGAMGLRGREDGFATATLCLDGR
jgi:hypothetical protein